MKKLLSFLLLLIVLAKANGQKLSIDTEVLSEVIVAKQEELKMRLLSDIVVRNVRTTNYATYNTLYYLINGIVEEKNKTIMTQTIVKEIGRYVVSHLAAKYVVSQALGGSLKSVNTLEVPERLLIKRQDTLFKTNIKQSYIQSFNLGQMGALNDTVGALFYLYAIDTLYQELHNNTILSQIGLFDTTVSDRFITSGLGGEYDDLPNQLREKFPNEYVSVKTAIQQVLTSGNISPSEFERAVNILDKFNFTKYPKSPTGKVAFDISSVGLSYLLQQFDAAMRDYKEDIGKGAIVAKLAEIITKYVVFDIDENENETYEFKIDVEAIILSLEEEFLNFSIASIRKHWVGIKPFFSIGFNYGYFIDNNNTLVNNDPTAPEPLDQLSLASERIGLKFIFADQKYTRSQKPNEWYQYKGSYHWWNRPPKRTVFNNFYGMIYASGILYNIVDIKSEESFSYPIIGTGLGVTFFNDLELNVSWAIPIDVSGPKPVNTNNSFLVLGFDAPIFEYLKAQRKK